MSEEQDDLPRRLLIFVDGKFMTILMTLLTVYALWGDDFRIAFAPKEQDFREASSAHPLVGPTSQKGLNPTTDME